MLSVSAILSGVSRAMSDVAAGAAKTTGTIGAATDDFVTTFGKGGIDVAGLKTSLDPTNANLNDAGLRTMLSGSGTIDDAAFNRAKTAREYFLNRREAGKYDTLESFEAVSRNIDDTGSALGGYSAAGQTRSESFLTNIFGTGDRSIGGELGFLAASGAIGGGVNYMAGGEFGTGAGVGMLAGTGIRGAGRLVQNSMADIETSMMKRLLGESEYGKLTAKPEVKAVAQETLKGKYGGRQLKDVLADNSGLTLKDLGIDPKTVGNRRTLVTDNTTLGELDKSGLGRKPKSKFFNQKVDSLTTDPIVTPAVAAQPAQSVRTQALNAIQGMSAEQVKERGIGSSYIQKMLTNKDKGNMGRNMRVMTVSGAALAGVPFTGRRNDHSSGFNKNRGNKI